MDLPRTQALVDDALNGADDGELFLEYRQSEAVTYDDGRIRNASFDTAQGFGLRSVAGEVSGYAHASDLSEDALKRSAETVRAVVTGHGGTLADGPRGTNADLYGDANPLAGLGFEDKVALLEGMNAYARGKDPRVKQVTASIAGEWQAVQIIRPGGERAADIRPLVRVNVSVVVEQDGRMETGSHGTGGRTDFAAFIEPEAWKSQIDEALRQALVGSGIGAGTGRRTDCRTRSRLARHPAA